MSDPRTGEPGTSGAAEEAERHRAPEQGSAWAVSHARSRTRSSHWLAFGGWVLTLAGAFNVIAGLAALVRPDYYVVGSGELLVFDYDVWGWVWLAVGVLQVLTGVGCLSGQRWARIAGVGLAGLAAIGHATFLAAFPLWELMLIALSVLVMYALVVPDEDATA
ncbi:hypothetical protein EIL87_05775 [Saccharopolyspora rhizosphaerae]|uniref:DUF7144 domain-containing protein n=1 Tax=Saccharopolyspora rhizosphaerae TaxID=2492662 RepID=A0A426JZU6_9PSEU|nr:hypothetical protein [Saccharopolyspora rhizosphaerae]RRO18626.1 hypothetical protein EIL87_05775 [Saccharopolyspora rhizosphaerae]